MATILAQLIPVVIGSVVIGSFFGFIGLGTGAWSFSAAFFTTLALLLLLWLVGAIRHVFYSLFAEHGFWGD